MVKISWFQIDITQNFLLTLGPQDNTFFVYYLPGSQKINSGVSRPCVSDSSRAIWFIPIRQPHAFETFFMDALSPGALSIDPRVSKLWFSDSSLSIG